MAARTWRTGGQALTEFAVLLPVLLLLVLGAVDVGRALYFRESVADATRDSLRVATQAVFQSTGDSECSGTGSGTVTDSVVLTGTPAGKMATIASYTMLESSTTGLASGTVLNGATLTMTWHCLTNKAVTNTTQTSSDPSNAGSPAIKATVTYSFTPLVFTLPFIGTTFPSVVPIGYTSFQRVQY